jgi:hypothetical protein
LQAERLDRNQWKQYTALMADSGRFVDMLHGVNWQDGLNLDVSNGKFQMNLSQNKQFTFLFSCGIIYSKRSRWNIRGSIR